MNKFTFSHETEGFHIEMNIAEDTADEVVQSFTDFLKACTFAEGSIKNALLNVAEDLDNG